MTEKPRAETPGRGREAPVPNGLTRTQAARVMELVARPDTEGEGWSQLDAMRTNSAKVDSAAARGAMLLWAARNDYRVWLDQLGWATHYTHDELLYLLRVGRSRATYIEGGPLHHAERYGALALARGEDLARIVEAHRRARSLRPAWLLGFRLLGWLTGHGRVSFYEGEVRALVGALAEAHIVYDDHAWFER